MADAAAISRFPRLGLFQYFFPVHSAALPSPGDLKEFYQIIARLMTAVIPSDLSRRCESR